MHKQYIRININLFAAPRTTIERQSPSIRVQAVSWSESSFGADFKSILSIHLLLIIIEIFSDWYISALTVELIINKKKSQWVSIIFRPSPVTQHCDLTDQVMPLQALTFWYQSSTMTKPHLWYDCLRWSLIMKMLDHQLSHCCFGAEACQWENNATLFLFQKLIKPNVIAKKAAAPKKAAAKKAAPKRVKKTAAKKPAKKAAKKPAKKAAKKAGGRGKKWSSCDITPLTVWL